jgi:PilZ domain
MAKKVHTTGEVARLIGVNINTVIKWFDDGKIGGFKLPFSNERRISAGQLHSFMVKHKIPMDLLNEDTPMRRADNRVSVEDEVSFKFINGKTFGPYQGRLSDVSRGGAKIRVADDKPLSIPSHDFDVDLQVSHGRLAGATWKGKIMHFQPEAANQCIGLQFLDLEVNEAKRLDRFLDTVVEK